MKASEKKPERVVHCWEDGPKTDDGMSTTCMLLDGHDGAHEWTRDDGFNIKFVPEDANAK